MIKADKDGVFWGSCDFDDCDHVFLTDRKDVDDARKTLVEHGWTSEGEKVFCVAHSGHDMVNNPPHYTFGKFEVIDVVEDWQLDFNLGNAVKYIARHRHKGRPLEDLKKARWYLERAIQNLEKK